MPLLSLILVLMSGITAPPAVARDLDVVLGDDGVRDLDGHVWKSRDLTGRVVLIDVWATWCAPCLAELPTLRRIQADHGARLVVLGVSLDTLPRRDFISWLSRRQVSWPQIFDGRGYSGPLASRLGFQSVPVSWLFDHQGKLVARDLRGASLERHVRDLIAPLK